ncbi:hypothetical protein Xoosp13_73 [Xanthomonas phage Xoo-sp13]|nr:hypothetical protein Xoosp13_73 [Xanthomonas phage Xoo-sp13]
MSTLPRIGESFCCDAQNYKVIDVEWSYNDGAREWEVTVSLDSFY